MDNFEELRKKVEDYPNSSLFVPLAEEYKKRGSVGIKLAHAYGRTLASDNVPEDIAANIFAKALGGGSLSSGEVKQLQDHIIFFL